jgi:hypothetical protein
MPLSEPRELSAMLASRSRGGDAVGKPCCGRSGVHGTVFPPHLERSPWLRFNVAVCGDTRVQRWLQRQAADKAA